MWNRPSAKFAQFYSAFQFEQWLEHMRTTQIKKESRSLSSCFVGFQNYGGLTQSFVHVITKADSVHDYA